MSLCALFPQSGKTRPSPLSTHLPRDPGSPKPVGFQDASGIWYCTAVFSDKTSAQDCASGYLGRLATGAVISVNVSASGRGQMEDSADQSHRLKEIRGNHDPACRGSRNFMLQDAWEHDQEIISGMHRNVSFEDNWRASCLGL